MTCRDKLLAERDLLRLTVRELLAVCPRKLALKAAARIAVLTAEPPKRRLRVIK